MSRAKLFIWIVSICTPPPPPPPYVMQPPFKEHVPLHSKSLCKILQCHVRRLEGGKKAPTKRGWGKNRKDPFILCSYSFFSYLFFVKEFDLRNA